MSANLDPRYERLMDLLADQALFGLDEADSLELKGLLQEFPEVKGDEFELTAASVLLASQSTPPEETEPLPKELRQRLEEQSQQEAAMRRPSNGHVAINSITSHLTSHDATNSKSSTNGAVEHRATHSASPVSSEQTVERATQSDNRTNSGSPRTERTREIIAWLIATAAMIIAFAAWFDRGQADSDVITPQPVTLAQLRQSLIDSRTDAHEIDWSVNDAKFLVNEGAEFKGDVVWSDEAQEGYMTFSGLAANVDSEDCYQLWIFDKEGDERYPVDGGTFQIRNDGEATVVPIDAKLAVSESTMFAITVEKSPGVVVSDRSRLPLLATVVLDD